MPRLALKMHLNSGAVAEYQRRHKEIWPELATESKTAGVSDYSIFLDEEEEMLLAVQLSEDTNPADELPDSPVICK